MIHVKAGTIIIHCIGWLLFLLLPILFIILFYSHAYYIFPEWYQKNKYLLYASFLPGFLVLFFFVSPFEKLVGMSGRGGMRPENIGRLCAA